MIIHAPPVYDFLLFQTVKNDHVLDTIGVICVDSGGQVAAAISSGGIALKRRGRVGQVVTIHTIYFLQNTFIWCDGQTRNLLSHTISQQLVPPGCHSEMYSARIPLVILRY